MISIYFVIIFFLSFIYADLSAIILFKIGTFQIYVIDFLFVTIFFIVLNILSKRPIKKIFIEQKSLTAFVVIFLLSIITGLISFGGRALGEGRYIYIFFAFIIPLFFYYKGVIGDFVSFERVFKNTIIIAGIAALILFIVEIIYGGRFFFSELNQDALKLEDFRGTRYLGSEETYNLTVLWLFIFVNVIYGHKNISRNILIMVLLFVIIIFTKNRTAPLSIFISFFIVYFFIEKRLKLIITAIIFISISILSIWIIFPELINDILLAFGGVIDFQSDQTGSWRYAVQYSAFLQGMETPIIGRGYGSYFAFFVPEFNKIIELPPHNIFVFLFLKSGLIGVLAFLALLLSLSYQAIKLKPYSRVNPIYEKYRIIFLILFISQFFYGMAYGFSMFLGLSIGFFFLFKVFLLKK